MIEDLTAQSTEQEVQTVGRLLLTTGIIALTVVYEVPEVVTDVIALDHTARLGEYMEVRGGRGDPTHLRTVLAGETELQKGEGSVLKDGLTALAEGASALLMTSSHGTACLTLPYRMQI